jgi:hypothetical protein
MVPFDRQLPTVIRPHQIAPDVTYEPLLRVGFGINDQTVAGAKANDGPDHAGTRRGSQPHALPHRERRVLAHPLWPRPSLVRPKRRRRPQGRDPRIPSGAIHVIANASATEEASLIFCYFGVGNTADAQTVWLDQTPGGARGT